MMNTSNTGSHSNQFQDSEQHLGQFIPLHYHYQMLLDQARVGGFKQAILRAVQPGDKVVELGAGTGILSYFAAQKASKVWSVERNPQMVQTAKSLLKRNNVEDKVEVICADATEFCPPEQVSVVICEMLHSALLREKQIQVIQAFRRNYQVKFPEAKLPTFIPEATILAAQPIEQNFNFHGFDAPISMFFQPHDQETKTTGLGEPVVYSFFEYRKDLPVKFDFSGTFRLSSSGFFNAVRFVTKNVLSIDLQNNATIDWHNFYLILPLVSPIKVTSPTEVSIQFSYQPGDPIESLQSSLSVKPMPTY